MTSDLGVAAAGLAERGWTVFPVRPRDKVPLTPHGHRDATTDLTVIERWWRQWPHANIGGPVPTGTVVLDCDDYRDSGGDGDFDLPPTRSARTGGGGRHLWYRCPLDVRKGRLTPSIDVRAGGRHYVVLPPSIHAGGGRYEWTDTRPPATLPGEVMALLAPPPPPPPPRRALAAGGVRPKRPGDAFEEATTWGDVLEPFGWALVGPYHGDASLWRRPGKSCGHSAVTGGKADVLCVWSCSTPFEPERSYTRFGAYAVLAHGGDFSAAARSVRREMAS